MPGWSHREMWVVRREVPWPADRAEPAAAQAQRRTRGHTSYFTRHLCVRKRVRLVDA